MGTEDTARIARQITTPDFPSDWGQDLVASFTELFAAANGNEEGKDRLYDLEHGLANATTDLSLLAAAVNPDGTVPLTTVDGVNTLTIINTGVTPAANKYIYFSSENTATTGTITADMRTVLTKSKGAAVSDPDTIQSITNYAGQTVSAGYVQAEAQQTDDAVRDLENDVTALAVDVNSMRTAVTTLIDRLQALGLIS